MPGCAAVGCNNRSEKGYIMKCFPRDPKLRKIWQERVARADWKPSNNSFLCHVHFEPQEWSITESGRIRLKKNAIPSIFTITSTRKSPKKRKKLIHTKKEDCQSSQNMEYLEVDTECSSTGNIEGKDSDFEDIDEISQSLTFETPDNVYQMTKMRNNFDDHMQHHVAANNAGDEDMVLVSDEYSTERDHFLKKNNTVTHTNKSDEISGNSNGNQGLALNNSESLYMRTEIKSENTSKFEDNYDDIEEKLKQICDGRNMNDEDYLENDRINCITKKQNDTERNAEINLSDINNKILSVTEMDYKEPIKHEIGDILIDNRENVEIIFGTESGDEKMDTSQSVSCISNSFTNPHEIADSVLNMDGILCIKEEKKAYNEDIEENFGKDEVHVIPNMRAAMKRKRRTREEIMKSIKKSIGSTSEQDINFTHNSDISDNNTEKQMGIDMKANNKRNIKANSNHAQIEKTEFTIKISGDPDNVCDIVQELTAQGNANNFQEVHNSYEKHNHRTVVTSVIKLKDYPINLHNVAKELCNSHEDFTIKNKDCFLQKNPAYTNNTETINLKIESVSGTQKNNLSTNSTQLDKKMFNFYNSSQTINYSNKMEQLGNLTAHDISCDYELLQQRSKMQEKVIQKLTNRLIVFKEMENNLRKQSKLLHTKTKEVEMLTNKLNTRAVSTQSLINNKKSLESKQRLIEDLSNRVNYLEVVNKKLMKTMTLESQQKRKLEGHIKQKDEQIKELNWKLEKASKYLERAEKNTNTYRRKMLNMQTVMKRKKLLDERMSWFNELLIDSSKGEFSEKILKTAVAIRKDCGKDGYIKLIDYGFPLPSLTALKKFLNTNLLEGQSNDETNQDILNKKEQLIKDVQRLNNETEIDTKDSGILESDNKPTDLNTTETITGTVQDIFNENNDGDDFTSHELKKHFMEQLSVVM